jgi:hypothetical protein
LGWDVSVTEAIDARVRELTVMVECVSVQTTSVMVKTSSEQKGAAEADMKKKKLKKAIHFARRVILARPTQPRSNKTFHCE